MQRLRFSGWIKPPEDDHIRQRIDPIARVEEIEVVESELQRANVAVEELFNGKDIDSGHAVRRETVAHKLVKLLRHQMKRNVAAGVGIDHDEVIWLGVPVQEHAGVALNEMKLFRFAKPEIFLGDVDHARIELDGIDRGVREKAVQIDRDRSGAETEDEHALDVLRIDCGSAHDPGVQHRQVVGIRKIHFGFVEVPALPLEGQFENVRVLADEDVVVHGFEVRDLAVFPRKHLGAYGRIERVFGVNRRDRQQQSAGDQQYGEHAELAPDAPRTKRRRRAAPPRKLPKFPA